MDLSAKLENLKTRVNEMVATAQAATEENREQLKRRVDQAQDDANRAMQDAKQQADETADRAKSKWAQMNADIPGATAGTYTLEDADAGHTTRVSVTYTNAAGATPRAARRPRIAARAGTRSRRDLGHRARRRDADARRRRRGPARRRSPTTTSGSAATRRRQLRRHRGRHRR